MGELNHTVPAVTSVSAPGNIGRMAALQLGFPAPANGIDLNIVLSDVAEEDTDLEDGHVSPVSSSSSSQQALGDAIV